jgi:protein-disulfide isomerase
MRRAREIGEQVATVIVVVCTLTMTWAVVRREFFAPRPQITRPVVNRQPVVVENWPELLASGQRIGPPDAPVTILEFSDFECPFCRRFSTQTLPAVRRQFPNEVNIVYRHWPLSRHRLAYPAARAAECAAVQGRFEAFHDLLFAQQDSLGRKPFVDFAQESGVRDLGAFEKCNAVRDPVAQIESDLIAVKQLGGTGTPTVVVNGLRLPGTPDSATMVTHVRAALAKLDKKLDR